MPTETMTNPRSRTTASGAGAAADAPATMRALVQHTYGSPDDLRFDEVAVPMPRANEVLVRIHAASVNHADATITSGRPYVLRLALGLRRPKLAIRGQDVAGRVEAIGDAVTRFLPGDEVFAEVVGGGFAEFVCVREAALVAKPVNLTLEAAAAVPMAATTALQGLRDRGRIQAGQRVLINGASGGVGTFAVQIAKALGAEVTGVCSTRNADLVHSLGATVVDYTREDFVARGVRYDLILDLAGNRTLAELRRTLTPMGTLVLSSGRGGRVFGPMGRILRAAAIAPWVKHELRSHMATPNAGDLATIRDLVEAGHVTPIVERMVPWREARTAIRHVATGHARAKVVVAMDLR